MIALFSGSSLRTSVGQVSTHTPQPVHAVLFTSTRGMGGFLSAKDQMEILCWAHRNQVKRFGKRLVPELQDGALALHDDHFYPVHIVDNREIFPDEGNPALGTVEIGS